MDANVVVFPDPVGPVIKTRPLGFSVKEEITGGSPSSWKVLIS
jgi:hypothetical protein